jgi:PIN domain nuclease of toxin-antitoxin system
VTTAEAPLLLDTHVWIWLNQGDPTLAAGSRRAIEAAAARGRGVLVSVMSVWEVGWLDAKGRLRLDMPCWLWVEKALAPPLALAPLTPQIALESTRLPDYQPQDPMDRFLLATARVAGLVLVTRDRRMLDYGRKGNVLILAA